MANVSLQPDARRAEHRRADRLGGRRHLRRRRQELVDRHAALQLPVHRPALLPHPARPAGGAAARRGLPGDRPPSSGGPWRRPAASRPTCWAGRSTAARGSPGQVAPVSHGCPAALFRQVRVLNTAEEERPVNARGPGPRSWWSGRWTCPGRRLRGHRRRGQRRQPALGQQHPHDQRRDLAATSSPSSPSSAARSGWCRRAGSPWTRWRPWSGPPSTRPAPAPKAEDQRRRWWPAAAPARGWDDPPAETSIRVFEPVRAGARARPSPGPRRPAKLLFGYAEHEMRTTYVASSTGLRARHDQPTGHLELNAKSADFGRSRLGRRGHRRLRRRRRGVVDGRPEPAPGLGRPADQTCRPGATRPSCRRARWPT